MKKISLLSLLFAVFTSAAFATDKAGDACPQTGYITSQVGGHVGATQVTLAIQLMDGDKLLTSTTATTLDGQPVPISIGNERSYIAETKKEGDKVVVTPGMVKDGFFMTMTPILTQDGKITVEFIANKSEVTAIQTFKQGDLEIQLPQVSTVDLKQKLALENGKEIVIPFGPLVESMKSVETGKPARAQYTLKLVATKN